ncbi:MAG: aminotransferase class I/II-fold pyridoxal phosphate-dependent enzyme [Chloroflexi bacterium]|nr:aminotransferase class I/II-fold pyridoxal phosphate-dependent enzyme [Chloroflexota bacterium]MQC26730.1 aminotransferase class I/II-fold pyridoxal phosphate-dependent enzyme [Chloroflexota bacterium]
MKPAQRISSIQPYFFAQLGKRITAMRSSGVDVIRMDMGSPDLPPPDAVVEALATSARLPTTHGYTLGSGTGPFRKAAARHYAERFEVELDPGSEVIDLLGSKEGLFILSQVLLNPGDLALVPDPSYSVYAVSAEIAGAEVHLMPLLAENAFLPDLGAIPADIAKRAKILWLNYPNNPTGAIADLDFFARAVEFARKNDILLAHDAPYTEVGFNGYQAPSLLQIDGAKEVAVEFNSLSKAYNMAGWRIGMALGNAEVVGYIETYKSQQDSAVFAPILAAGELAFQTDLDWIVERNRIYQLRRDAVVDGLHTAGLHVQPPQAALYVWVPIPAEETSSLDFCARLLEDTGVSTTPGVVFGKHGEGYLRISLVTELERLQEGTRRIADWVNKRY